MGCDATDVSTETSRDRRQQLLVAADLIVARLAPGKRESVREILVNAKRRGFLSGSGRQYLDRVTGSSFVGDLLVAILAEAYETPDTLEAADPPGLAGGSADRPG